MTTVANLESLEKELNKAVGFSSHWYRCENGPIGWNVGAYSLYQSSGGIGLEQITNESGGTRVVFHLTNKTDLADRMTHLLSNLRSIV